jgi:hypothetical protein
MKRFCYSLLLWVALAGPAATQTNLAGKWQGRLEAAPGQTLAIQFVFAAAPGGGYSAVVTSPDEGAIKNVRAASVKYADNRLTVEVPELSGGYVGTLRNGVLEGEWSQEGAKLPLSLKPFETPTLTRKDNNVLRGEWVGKLEAGGTLTIVLRFNTGASGVSATLDVPEQGVKDWAGINVTLDDGHFSVDFPRPRAKVTGKLDGDQIVGQWNQSGNSLPLTLKKGRYVAVPSYLDLPATAREQLKGSWNGTLNGLPVIVSFETDAQGRTQGFFNSTQQRLVVAIKQAALTGTTLTFGTPSGSKYTAELADNKLTGEWAQPGLPKPLPLVLTRGPAPAPVVQTMTRDAAAPYLGVYWFEEAQRPVVIVFEKNGLALEVPGQTLRPLVKTNEPHVWAHASNANNLMKFQRDGNGPATAIDMRQLSRSAMLKRFEPEAGLPSVDDLFKRRPDRERATKLASLGILRMSGSAKLTTSVEPGKFELLAAGNDRFHDKTSVNGIEVIQVVAGGRAWVQYGARAPVEELPKSRAQAARHNGWLLATGDWRSEFEPARVLKRMELDGKPVFLVHAAPKQGRQRFIYLDAETGLAHGYDEVQELPEVGMVGCEVRVADYRDVDGVQIPFKVTVKFPTPTLGTHVYQVEKIETRVKLEKDPFNARGLR